MAKQEDSALWREIGRTAKIMGGVVAVYTIGVALASPEQLLGWLNTLLSTVLSVFSAVVIGLALFRYQTKQTDHKKREEIGILLESELEELRRSLVSSRTHVPDEALEDTHSSTYQTMNLSIHHSHPLVIEEAIRSGLFGAELTAGMLVLAREMKAHHLFLRDATSLEPHMDLAWAAGLKNRSGREEFFRLFRRYAQAVRMVQLSEESIVAGCEKVLKGLR